MDVSNIFYENFGSNHEFLDEFLLLKAKRMWEKCELQ
jgi:hypothetical protein